MISATANASDDRQLEGSEATYNPAPSWTSVTVGVADLEEAVGLWAGLFGFDLRARQMGPDPGLAALWGLKADDIQEQALLATAGANTGMLHLVQFSQAGAAVRDDANVFDFCPKNLDVYVQDLPRRVQELKAAGLKFRNDHYSEVTAPDGTLFREIHLPAHDAVNIVLLELVGKDLPFTPQGFAGIGPLITIVADVGKEKEFYRLNMQQKLLSENILEGPEIERMVGLPPGSALDVSIWGVTAQPMGQMELISYRGVQGEDLYPLAVPMQRGILHVTYQSVDLDEFTDRLQRNGTPWEELGEHASLAARGRFIRVTTPAGMRIEVFQP